MLTKSGKVAAVELHPLDDVHLRVGGLALLDGDDAVGPTSLSARAMFWPISAVVVRGDRGDFGDTLDILGVDGLGELGSSSYNLIDALLDARNEGIGSCPPATARSPVGRCARRDGGGLCAVAGDVGGLAGGLLTSERPCSRTGRSASNLGDVTPVLGDGGAAQPLSRTAYGAWPRVCGRRVRVAGTGEQLFTGVVGVGELLAPIRFSW